MSRAVEAVRPDMSLSDATSRMRQRNVHHLVVTRAGRLTGILSARDLGELRLPASLGQWTVEDLMTSPVQSVTIGTSVRRAATLVKGRSLGSLVVTSASGVVAGIVTVADLLAVLARQPEDGSNRQGRRRPAPLTPERQRALARPADTPARSTFKG